MGIDSKTLVTVLVLLGSCLITVSAGDQDNDYDFKPGSIGPLCPKWVGGDREFNGHGPDVRAWAELYLDNDGREVWVELYLHAKETMRDWTEAEGTWTRHLWTAPRGYVVDRIVSDERSEAEYRDEDHHIDSPDVRGGDLVNEFEIMGDTRGNDVDNCTLDDVFMKVYFNRIEVRLSEY